MTPAQNQKNIRARRKANGLCTSCGQSPPIVNQVKCSICHEKDDIYRQSNRTKIHSSTKLRYNALKDAAFAAYGGYTCKCCHEEEPKFLSLDHSNNDGAAHRASLFGGSKTEAKLRGGGGWPLYRWLRNNDYPPGFQVLCMNCNFGRAQNNGRCPHEDAVIPLLVSIC